MIIVLILILKKPWRESDNHFGAKYFKKGVKQIGKPRESDKNTLHFNFQQQWFRCHAKCFNSKDSNAPEYFTYTGVVKYISL